MGLECEGYARELIFVHAAKQPPTSKAPASAHPGTVLVAAADNAAPSCLTNMRSGQSSSLQTVKCVPRGRTNTYQSLCRTDVTLEAYPGSATVERRRMLGLELMHRWRTATHMSFCFLPEDMPFLQAELPRWGLKHEFLMDGLLAMSSLDVALRGGSTDNAHRWHYVRTAMEHYNTSSSCFRAQLRDIRHDNIHILWMYSYMAIVINVALFQCLDASEPSRMLQYMAGLLELFIGCSSLGDAHINWLLESPIGAIAVRANERSMPAINTPLEGEVHVALTRLMAVVSSGASTLEVDEASASTSARLDSHRKAVVHLRNCFAISINSGVEGFCGEFLSLAGRRFLQEVKDSDPEALFILLHWAVLLQSVHNWIWWARPFGSILVHRISDILVQSHPELVLILEWQEGIAWARRNSLDREDK